MSPYPTSIACSSTRCTGEVSPGGIIQAGGAWAWKTATIHPQANQGQFLAPDGSMGRSDATLLSCQAQVGMSPLLFQTVRYSRCAGIIKEGGAAARPRNPQPRPPRCGHNRRTTDPRAPHWRKLPKRHRSSTRYVHCTLSRAEPLTAMSGSLPSGDGCLSHPSAETATGAPVAWAGVADNEPASAADRTDGEAEEPSAPLR
jgi:hypothetical protein